MGTVVRGAVCFPSPGRPQVAESGADEQHPQPATLTFAVSARPVPNGMEPFKQPPKQPLQALVSSGSEVGATVPEGYLFEPPSDLVCPITHELFVDPVLNAAGQVYERTAFVRYLNGCGLGQVVDPVTRIPLGHPILTPVVVMRSRALEYREQVARRCVELACQKDCPTPLRFVRRAAELVEGVELHNPVGMTVKDGESGDRVPPGKLPISLFYFHFLACIPDFSLPTSQVCRKISLAFICWDFVACC